MTNGVDDGDARPDGSRPEEHAIFPGDGKAERLVQTTSEIGGSVTYDLVPVETPLGIRSYKSMR
jgi:hypothetical protein